MVVLGQVSGSYERIAFDLLGTGQVCSPLAYGDSNKASVSPMSCAERRRRSATSLRVDRSVTCLSCAR